MRRPVFIPRMSPSRHSALMLSPHHTLCVCSNPVKTARHGKPHLTVCPALPLPNWVGRPWRLEIWIFNANKWKKACLLCLPHKMVPNVIYLLRKCELRKSTCISVCFRGFFFVSAFGAEIECFAAPNYCWFYSQEFLAFSYVNILRPFLCLTDSACGSWSLPRISCLSWMNDFV